MTDEDLASALFALAVAAGGLAFLSYHFAT